MSDEGEMTCPLCAEEMDLTDQQLKPCKCGYEICVWCWHHIMEMAGKQDAEGRCPACRTAYDKDRIVGMSSNCERLVAESNGERKTRSQKARAKATVEARKHLGSVRVIQRNLVYIIGLPLSLFHGNVLERREYFGQYGKVLKVSMSRPSTGSQVAPSSNTFNVYITYAKEEEAVRCIQAVHNFVLDGKQLRACFGTTKYCHAWLRNMPCNNPDCFYLHDIGCQEDSFTKDEVISAYTRSRVSQTITGNSSQQHLGTVLPPPADDFNNAAKPSVKSAIKTSSSDCASVKIPPTCSNLSKSVPLPAAALWGSTLSSSASSILCSRSIKQKQENSVGQPTAISCKKPLTFPKNLLEKGKSFRKDEMGPMDVNIKVSCSSKESIDADSRSNAHLSSDLDYLRHTSAWHDGDALPSARIPERSLLVNSDERSLSLEGSTLCAARDPPKISSTSSLELTFDENVLSSWDDDDSDDRFILPKTIEGTQAVFLNDTNAAVDCSGSSFMKDYESNLSNSSEISTGQTSNSVNATCSAAYTIEKKGILILESQKDKSFHCSRESGLLETDTGNVDIHNDGPNKEVHELSDDMKMLKFNSKCGTHINSMYDQEGLSSVGSLPAGMPKLDSGLQDRRGTSFFTRARSSLVAEACFSRERSDLITEQYKQLNENTLEQCPETPVLAAGVMGCSNLDVANQTVPLPLSTQPVNFQSNHQFFYDGGHKNTGLSTMPETVRTNVSGLLIPCTDFAQQNAGSSDHEFIVKATSKFSMVGKEEMQESSIISNILSMDVNPWDVSSPSDFVKLLCEADKQTDGVKLSNLLKGQNNKGNNQSRFSFARLEGHSVDSFSNENGMLTRNTGYLDHELPTRGLDGSNCQTPNGCSLFSSENNSALQRSKASARIYAPPGFLSSSRAPPPGFSSSNRLSITHESSTVAAYVTPGSNISRSQNQVALPGNTEDLDFIDPAILAVGKGSLPFEIHGDVVAQPFPAYSNSYNVNKGDLLLQQQSITSLQDHIVSGFIGNMYLPSKDANLPPHFVAQNNGTVPYFPESTAFLNVHMSKNHWNAQNDAQSLTNVHSRNDFVTLNSLRNELFVRNKYFPGSEEHDFLSKKAFGM